MWLCLVLQVITCFGAVIPFSVILLLWVCYNAEGHYIISNIKIHKHLQYRCTKLHIMFTMHIKTDLVRQWLYRSSLYDSRSTSCSISICVLFNSHITKVCLGIIYPTTYSLLCICVLTAVELYFCLVHYYLGVLGGKIY